MHIYCLGLNHQTANISLRERVSFTEEQIRSALARLGCGGWDLVSGMVIISTCNRTELYAASSQPIFGELEAFLVETRGVPVKELRKHLYRLKDGAAVRHLLRVAAGLDSLVLGEPQILGQVTRALELARGQNASGPLLSRLFQQAIHAGKRARTETHICRNPASVSSVAASLAEQTVHYLAEARIAVLGAGEMAELAVESLRKRGARRVTVVNRTLERAQSLADRWQAKALTFEHLDQVLINADILISSTGAPHTIVYPDMVKAAMQKRAARPMLIIDIAVPRDVDPDVGNLPGVRLYDMDGLSARLEHSLTEREAEIPLVESVLAEEEAKFLEYFESLDMLPLITGLRKQAESIRQKELEKTLRRLPDLSDVERDRIEALTHAIVKKLLESPTSRLRAEASCAHAPEYAAVARSLFDIPGHNGSCQFSGQICHITGDEQKIRDNGL